MLGSLGSALKKGFDKIAGAIFLDKKTIDLIVKDLQRALIQADVNVHLVKEIGDKIKKEANLLRKLAKNFQMNTYSIIKGAHKRPKKR